MSSPLAKELQHHAGALRAVARALVGIDAADDLVQDTAVQVLGSREAPDRPAAFLRRIVTHLAGKHRRSERRRLAREALASEPAVEPGPDWVVAHRETLQRLNSALLALPEPFLGALLLRYFEDLPPTAIAARLRVPLPTVKSRLQRGLELLRERLDRDGVGADWRAGLVTAFGLERAADAGRTVVTTNGVLLMAIGAKVALAAAAVLVVAAWVWSGDPDAAPHTAETAVAGSAEPAAAEREVPPANAAAPTQQAARRDVTPIVATAPVAVRVRCVDEKGAPVAGAELRIHPGDPDDGAQWSVTAVTDADGAAVASFPTTRQWLLADVTATDRVSQHSNLPALESGSSHDLGTITMCEGVRVSAVVLDSDGRPRAQARAELGRVTVGGTAAAVWSPIPRATTDAGGRADFGLVMPGDYTPRVTTERLLSPLTARFDRGQPPQSLELRVDARKNQLALRGIVTDEGGLPVPEARVQVREVTDDFFATTDGAGRFEVWRTVAHKAGSIVVAAIASGKDEGRATDEVAWGANEVRIVLRERTSIVVHVSDARTGDPVEDFHVRIHRASRLLLVPLRHDQSTEVVPGHYANGIFTTSGEYRGFFEIRVTPADERWFASPFEVLLVDGSGPTHLHVRLQPSTTRTVQVVTAAGRPVVDCAVELCHPSTGKVLPQAYVPVEMWQPSGKVSLQTYVVPPERWSSTQVADKALLLQQGTTDANGRIVLRGPASTPLTIRLPGPGCLPAVHEVSDLAGDGDLRLVARAGGTLRVRVQPIEVLPELAKLGDPPGLRLAQRVGTQSSLLPPQNAEPLPFPADGLLTITGVGPGAWRPLLHDAHGRHTLPVVDIVEGESTDLAIDLAPLRPVTLHGSLERDGQPVRLTNVLVQRRNAPDEDWPGKWSPGRTTALDGEGRFTFCGLPGQYRVVLPNQTMVDGQLAAPTQIELAPGATATHVFAIATGTIALRFVDGDGKPVAGVLRIGLLRGPQDYLANLEPTGADGRVTLAGCEVGTHVLRVLPRRLGPLDAMLALYSKFPNDADVVEREYLDLGTVSARPGEPVEQVVVLPPTWFR